MDRNSLERLHSLNAPASEDAVSDAETAMGRKIPADYRKFLAFSNGLQTDGGLVLLEVEAIHERNSDYEVFEYLPGYLMIGDDSGGMALVMKEGSDAVYEVDMGAMDEKSTEYSAASLETLLIEMKGETLAER